MNRAEVVEALAKFAWATEYGEEFLSWPPGDHWYQEETEIREQARKFYDRVLAPLLAPNHRQVAPRLGDDLRAKFLRRLTVDSAHRDRRRKDYNQAIFLPDGPAVFTSTTLDMVLAAFDAAAREAKP